MTEKRRLLVKENNRKKEDIISSQSSSESFFFQAYEDIRSSSGSNSEAEDGWNLSRNLGYPSEQAERIAAPQQYHEGLLFGHQQLENTYSYPFISKVPHNQPSVLPSTNNYWPDSSLGLEKWEADVLAFSGKESTSTLASAQFDIINGTAVEHGHDYKGQRSENTYTGIQNEIPKFQLSPMNHAIPNKHLDLSMHEECKSFQESTFLMDPTRPAEAFGIQLSDTTHESTKTGQVNSSNNQASSNIGTTTLNERKGKVEKEKAQPFDWDTLRKQVPSKAGTKGRSMGTMDSMDYEALRNADVREISDTIKERGMNNMLAERMKSVLNRLVQDHERIDLEWLRDVEPDKVKYYLLSIRGLGLKSVECIRLLTLHHLAFPVDTNVGRVAVRLGWVPLRPLPGSLQLHLLELYPVLESIQKYLWPRLCKLDQETLYELHYQMITFGKMFFTKREPNCNTCPMKGECRHFASAFASVRLALPGPEEKRIVREENGVDKNREPLIEEPTTPEPPKEVSERDIEDAFYEYPDEIPVIKLNVQEFTTKLQSFMQEQMKMGEADMSKAIVALSPELGSIPIPKLKHVNQLRTEHQVAI
ncbi:Protein ros1a [Orobanche gracilis]